MTIEEAIRRIEMAVSGFIIAAEFGAKEHSLFNVARDMAITALRAQQQREQLWHDSKTDPPPQDGLYYGAKDDTNAMWLVQYRDGTWTLNAYPEQRMDIVRWAFYDAFCGDSNKEVEKNEPLTLEELREMNGEPVYVIWGNEDKGEWYIVLLEEERLDNPWQFVRFESVENGFCKAYRRPPGKEV